MKIKTFRFCNSTENKDKNTIFENILFSTCIICFCVLILVQILLVIPSVRSSLNLSDKSVGSPLSSDEYLYNQGQMTLQMIGIEPDPLLCILVNGEPAAMFEKMEMSINVKDGDVVEIDGSQSQIGHIVKVEGITSNINSDCLNAVVTVEKDMRKLLKVRIN